MLREYPAVVFLTKVWLYLSAIREDGMPGGRNKSIGPVQVSMCGCPSMVPFSFLSPGLAWPGLGLAWSSLHHPWLCLPLAWQGSDSVRNTS